MKRSVGLASSWWLRGPLSRGVPNLRWHYQVDEGGGAFYGPKIDLKIRDAIGRTWQCSTVQADFNLPDRFDLEYVDRYGIVVAWLLGCERLLVPARPCSSLLVMAYLRLERVSLVEGPFGALSALSSLPAYRW